MFAKYQYLAGASQANALNDIVAILTGETDVNNLSAACDKANSYILTTWKTAGWTLHDAAAGANAKVIKQPYHYDPTKDVYVNIDANTAGYVLHKLYRTWNEVTHVGTDLSYNSDNVTAAQRVSSNGGILYISSSDRHLHMLSFQSGVWGSSSNTGSSGIFQRTQKDGWDTLANGYPPVCWMNFGIATASNGGVTSPRIVGNTGLDVTGSNAQNIMVFPFGANTVNTPLTSQHFPTTTVPDENKVPKHRFLPFGIAGGPSTGFAGGEVSGFADTYWTTYGYGWGDDEVNRIVNSVPIPYFIFPENTNFRLAVRKG